MTVDARRGCLNDIHGFGDPDLYPVLAASRCRLVVMHAVQAAGIGRDRLVIDPGPGYFLGRTPGPSLAALAGIGELKAAFGVPVLVSPSRRSFLHALAGKDVARSGPATLAAEIFAAWQGADYIRARDVAAARDALTFLAAITRAASRV